MEPLEARQMLAVFTVTSLSDAPVAAAGDAPGTLRQAVFDANHLPGADTIRFASNLSGDAALSIVGDTTGGSSALLITSEITIEGNANGITIERAAGAPEMRLIRIAPSGSLAIESIGLHDGLARGRAGVAPDGSGGDGRGGAVYNEGSLVVVASTIYGNAAIGGDGAGSGSGGNGLGGAIFNAGGQVTLVNATLSANSAVGGAGSPTGSAFGGAIDGINGRLSIHNSTITGSVATTGRGVFVVGLQGTAVVEIYSSIIAGSTSPDLSVDVVVSPDTGGEVSVAGDHNLIRRQIGFPPAWNVDPMLGPLANNGGPTLTHALLSTSPAIDQGSNPSSLTTDGRGGSFARVVGGQTDIGAFEIQTTNQPALPGDYNGNRVVDAADYVLWRKTLGTQVPEYAGADGSGNGTIDAVDHTVWREHFGDTLSGAAADQTAAEQTLVEQGSVGPAANETGDVAARGIASRFWESITGPENAGRPGPPSRLSASAARRLATELDAELLESVVFSRSAGRTGGTAPIAPAEEIDTAADSAVGFVWDHWLPRLAPRDVSWIAGANGLRRL